MTSKVLHRSSRVVPPVVTSAQGSWLTDSDGKSYLDGCGGAAVSCLGHGHRKVIDAMAAQATQVAYFHNSFFTTNAAEQLADLLISRSPPTLSKVYFVSDGSEAVEAALKLARQYFVERGETKRSGLISRRQSYHGNTLGALSVGGNMARREDYAPLLIETHHVSACFAYRSRQPDEADQAYVDRLGKELEDAIEKAGSETIMAFIAETVVGATAGAVPPVAGYFRRVREICDRYGILLILDEVMCGTGRTGTFHAFEQEGIAPDILTNAKGLGGGYQPIGAVYLSAAIDDAIRLGSGAFKHGHTYNGHAVACAAALAVQQTILEDGLVERARVQGLKLAQMLRDRLGTHAHVGDIRGRGLLQAIELIANRQTRPFEPSLAVAARIKRAAMRLGLCLYPGSGTIDGLNGDHILIAPAFTITDAELELIVDRTASAIDAALQELHA